MKRESFVVGLDFGTDTVRAVVVDAADGEVVGLSVKTYPRWSRGAYCDPTENRFRHHPLDYLETLESAVREALAKAGPAAASRVRGIAADTTGSTPALADAAGRPLALTPGFEENPDAMFILWKDHTSVAQAERLNQLARSWGGADYTRYVGGIYSSEWFWAKAIRALERDPAIARAAATLLELCDWIPTELTGTRELSNIRRSRCAAGHKALWNAEFGGYPCADFLGQLHPRLPHLASSFGSETWTSDIPFGRLSAEWAEKLGLPEKSVVAVGAFDAHMGAVGGGIAPHRLLKIVGTSSLDMLVAPKGDGPEKVIPGICGQVDGSIIPGAIGYEAGQSAFGDLFAWFRSLLAWPLEFLPSTLPNAQGADIRKLAEGVSERILPELEKAAQGVAPGESSALALDWMNGRRTPDANQRLKGIIAGISLGTDAPRLYRALVEAAAYGSRAIVERFQSHGVRIDDAVAIGGIPRKSPLAMQILADVTDMSIAVAKGDQAVALGAAMFAATAAGLYRRVEEAQQAMALPTERVYRPDPARVARYQRLYQEYRALGEFAEGRLTSP
jgi:L-ribulokinase